MKRLHAGLMIFVLSLARLSVGQALPAAFRQFDLSSTSGFTETTSGIKGAHQTGLTLGLNSAIFYTHAWSVATEVRATAPLSSNLVGESNAVGGLRLSRQSNRFTVYTGAFYGSAQLTYLGNGLYVPNSSAIYAQSHSGLFEVGIGTDIHLTATLSLHFEQQFERLSVPVTTSGHALALPVTVGFSYHPPYTRNGHPY